MTIQDAYNFFKSLKTETIKKSEIKIYEKFEYILSELKDRSFSQDEIQLIEAELDRLNLESPTNSKKKYFKKSLTKFETYLKDTFSLTTKDHYANIGIGLGSSFGILF